jgi:hypothetical protein
VTCSEKVTVYTLYVMKISISLIFYAASPILQKGDISACWSSMSNLSLDELRSIAKVRVQRKVETHDQRVS